MSAKRWVRTRVVVAYYMDDPHGSVSLGDAFEEGEETVTMPASTADALVELAKRHNQPGVSGPCNTACALCALLASLTDETRGR